jgi:hypothetical protein
MTKLKHWMDFTKVQQYQNKGAAIPNLPEAPQEFYPRIDNELKSKSEKSDKVYIVPKKKKVISLPYFLLIKLYLFEFEVYRIIHYFIKNF